MYYKLFLFGSKELFATIELMGLPAKDGDIFLFKGSRYKILNAIYHAREISFDDKGARIWNDSFKEDERMAELYITELPKF